MSEDPKALLEAQKEAILSSVDGRISGLQQTILKKQEHLASQIEAEDVRIRFKKRGNEQQFKFKVLTANGKPSCAIASVDAAFCKVLLLLPQ